MRREEGSTALARAAKSMGDPEALDLLSSLVSIAPTNLEDPAHGRWEKPHYVAAMDRILRTARERGFATRIYDPTADPSFHGQISGEGPRPNGIIDLDVGANRWALIMAHFDVVPVPEEQRSYWKSPPFSLTAREDGRLYGRGSNDDLGSGVVGGLTALTSLSREKSLRVNVRLLVCCDEETGGAGGIDAIREHDAVLPPDDPERILRADVVLIPDGSPHTTAGSSGVAFLDATADGPVTLAQTLAYGERLVQLDGLARTWRSALKSEDWPAFGAPEPVVTGRATVTKFDLTSIGPAGARPRVALVHTETEAANQIARSVTIAFDGPPDAIADLPTRLASLVSAPFHVEPVTATGARVPPGVPSISLVGLSGHGGYPHRAHNPVPAAIDLLKAAANRDWIEPSAPGDPAFVVDLRLPPEMELAPGTEAVFASLAPWIRDTLPVARVVAPPGRCRPGYALPVDHPMVMRLAAIMRDVFHEPGIFGEYGGTDASSVRGLTTPAGEPLPALVFGSMDRAAHIHEAEESLDPVRFAGVVEVMRRFVLGL